MKTLELLAPAGDLEKLKTAIDYGADAVYLGGESFSLRAAAGNFSFAQMKEGLNCAHERKAKCYLAINIFAHNEDIQPLQEYLEELTSLDFDGLIVSDPGILMMVKEILPKIPIHLSTQANTTNYITAGFWETQGLSRINLAREMSLDQIKELRKKLSPAVELEVFAHGAMCISYSGRCLLSNFMVQRDANQGACAHPCRWNYALVEEQRPGEYYPVQEDDRGTYILNSKDLCMIKHIPDLVQAGIASAKIEGRMKSSFYVATVVGAYRRAIDAYYQDPEGYVFQEAWMEELKKASHREFTTGFYFDKPTELDQNYQTGAYSRSYTFIGIVKQYDQQTGMATVEQRNKMTVGEEIEVFGPKTAFFKQRLGVLLDEDGNKIESAPHPQQMLQIKMEQPVKENFMLRRKD